MLEIYLAVLSFCDIRWKAMPLWLLLPGMGVSVGSIVIGCKGTVQGAAVSLAGLLPAVAFLFLSWVSKGGVGYGDGLVLFILGGVLGMAKTVEITMIGLGFAAVGSILILMCCREGRKARIPFVPFLLAAFLLIKIRLWIGGGI